MAIIGSTSINSLGLVFDIAGALLIWRFGLPQAISRTGAQHWILEEADEDEIRKAARYDRWALVGLSLLVGGFALQLISNFL